MSEHTPLPWSPSGLNIIGADRTVVCMLNRPAGDSSAAAFRNQDLIMRACNSHEALLGACKAAHAALGELCEHYAFRDDAPEFNAGGCGLEANTLLRAAIALAERGAA